MGKNEQYSGIQWIPEETSSYIYYKKDFLVMLEQDHYRFTASYKHFPVGMEERERKELTLYPNPADNSFRIGGLPDAAQDFEIILFNEAGALVRTALFMPGGVVNSAGLENWMYIIKMGDGGVGKVLIRHR
jgi:hypothetical protein